jgi:hypothetical protein
VLASASLLFALGKIEVIIHYAIVQVQRYTRIAPRTTGMWKAPAIYAHAPCSPVSSGHARQASIDRPGIRFRKSATP